MRDPCRAVLALVAVSAQRLDVGAVPEALRRQVHRLDVVDVLGGDRDARFGAGTAQRLAPEDPGAPPAIPLVPARAAEAFWLDRHVSDRCGNRVGNFAQIRLFTNVPGARRP